MGKRKRSVGFDDEMNETASIMPGQIVTAWATAPGVLMGEKRDGEQGVEQFVELTTFGQVLEADGSAAFEDGEPVVSMTRVFIPLDRVEFVIHDMRVAKIATPAGHPDKPEIGEGGINGSHGPPDRN